MAIKVHSDNLIFLNNLNQASDRLATAMGRLSTGARIQSAGDDAAGFMISKGLEVTQRGLNTANNNIQTGVSLLGIAEGSIKTMLSSLYRVRNLALQSSNGVYSDTERSAMQMEVDSLFDEIVRTKNTTEFNGVNLFGQQIYKDKSETFIDNETTAATSLLSYTPSANGANSAATLTTSATQTSTTQSEQQGAISRAINESEQSQGAIARAIYEGEQQGEVSLLSANPTTRASSRSASNLIEGTISLSSGKSKTLSFGDKVYTFTDWGSGKTANTCSYSYNTETGRLTISDTYAMEIIAGSGQEDDILVNNAGNYTFVYAGDMDDRIEVNGNGTSIHIYGENGNDTIIDNTTTEYWAAMHGGNGDDTIYLNKNLGRAFGGTGNDTIYVNGNKNTVYGEAGDDNFIVQGDGNFLLGNTGTNTMTDNGTNTGYYNISGLEDHNPMSGEILLGTNKVDLKFEDKVYTVSVPGNLSVWYSYNAATKTVTFGGSYANIVAADNQINNVILNNSDMIYTGGSGGEDNITVRGGQTTVNLGTGKNTVTLASNYNSIYTNGGEDTINIKSENNYVSCSSSGSANITVASGKNNNIINGGGNSSLTITTNSTSTGFINCSASGYSDYLPSKGTLFLKPTETFDLTFMEGTEHEASYTIKSRYSSGSVNVSKLKYSCDTTTGFITFDSGHNSNAITVTAHDGQDDKITISGNNVYLYTGDGDDIVNSYVTYNSQIYTGDGNDTLNILRSGSVNNRPQYYTQAGNDTVTIADGIAYTNLYTGDGDDTIEVNGSVNYIYAGDGADTITMNKSGNSIYAGDGDDTVYLNASNDGWVTDLGAGDDTAYINANNAGNIVGGDGDDDFTVADGVSGAFVDGNAGMNRLLGDASGTYRYNIEGYENMLPKKGSIAIAGSDTIEIDILGQTYTVYNRNTLSSILKFDYNETTGQMTFDGSGFTITSAAGQANNVVVNGDYMYFYGSDENDTIKMTGESSAAYGRGGDDTITIEGGKSYAYGQDGNDTIYLNGAQDYGYGEAGNDTIYVNSVNARAEGGAGDDNIILNSVLNNSSSWVKGGDGADTITVNSANNVGAIEGNAGDDTIIVNAAGNTVSAGAGANTLELGVDNVNYNINEYSRIVTYGNTGDFEIAAGKTIEFVIAGKTYAIQNLDSSAQTFAYNYDEGSGVITLDGDYLDITSAADQENNVVINGEETKFYGGNLKDIIVHNGDNGYVSGGDGDDVITLNGNSSQAFGGYGDDTIISNGDDCTVRGNAGDDKITINGNDSRAYGLSGNDTILVYGDNSRALGGAGNDKITIFGKNADVAGNAGNDTIILNGVLEDADISGIVAGGGDDTIIINTTGNNGEIVAGDGNNTIIINGSNNSDIELGDGNNTITTVGNNNIFAIGNGDNIITSNGDGNILHMGDGNNTITSTGDDNIFATGNGDNTITGYGNNNGFVTGDGADYIKVIGNSNTIATQGGSDTVLVDGNGNDIDLGADNDSATILGDSNAIDGDEGYDIITNGGTNTTITNCNELWKEADPFVFQVGTEANSNSTIEVSTGFVIPIIDLNVLNADSARASLEDIDKVIETLNKKLGEIGVSKNRLDSAYSANEVAQINITAAHSTIVDADIAQESMELLKAQILQNAAASLLMTARDINSTSLLNIYNSVGNLR